MFIEVPSTVAATQTVAANIPTWAQTVIALSTVGVSLFGAYKANQGRNEGRARGRRASRVREHDEPAK